MRCSKLSSLSAMVFALPFAVHARLAYADDCKSGWTHFNETDSCYYVGSDENWDIAEAVCVYWYAHLTSIENALENAFVASLIKEDKSLNESQTAWIGLRYQHNKWTWTDGSISTYMNWMKGRPENDAGNYTCTEILRDDYEGAKTRWRDVECDIRMNYVCKKPAGT